MRTKAAVLFSGGLDSVVVACQLAASGSELHLLTANLGKPRVVDYARQMGFLIKRTYDVPVSFHEIDMSSVYNMLKRNVGVGGKGHVPGYKMLYNTVGLAFTDSLALNTLYTGECLANFAYSTETAEDDPDETLFREHLGGKFTLEGSKHIHKMLADTYAYSYHTDSKKYYSFTIETPLYFMPKPDRIKLAYRLGVPLEYTFTCVGELEDGAVNDWSEYESLGQVQAKRPLHCGRLQCYFCQQRKVAFKLADVPDNTAYKEDTPLQAVWEEYLKQQQAT